VSVVITLSGPGTGTLGFISSSNADPVSLVLSGTTAHSSVSVRVARGTLVLGTVQVNGSLNSFIAARTSFVASFNVTGTLANLLLGDEAIAPSAISIGGSTVATVIRMGVVHDLSLTDAAAIKSLALTSWTDGVFATDAITAPSLGILQIKGGFDANLMLTSGMLFANVGSIAGGTWTVGGAIKSLATGTIASGWAGNIAGAIGIFTVKGNLDGALSAASIQSLKVSGSINGSTISLTGSKTALGALTVGGSLTNSQILSAGNIGKVSAAGASGSTVYAGVSAGTSGLPTASDFSAAASISSFIVEGKAPFADTFIGASSIGTVELADVTTDNGGTPFGLATNSLGSFALRQAKNKPVMWHAKESTTVFNTLPGDLKVEIL
jgi:hypothetical protein